MLNHQNLFFLLVLRWTFRLFGFLSPKVAANLAYRLWFHPHKLRQPDWEKELLSQCDKLDVEFKGKPLPVYAKGSGPTIMLLHGWGGRAGQMARFIDPLVAAGFRVVTFDQPAHGEAYGSNTDAYEILLAADEIIEQVGPVVGYIAHSFALTWLLFGFQRKLSAAPVVAVAPAANIEGFLIKFANMTALPMRSVEFLRQLILKRLGDDAFQKFSAEQNAKKMTVSCLVFHDRDDSDVPWQEGQSIADAWPQAQIHLTENLGHRRILRDPEVIRQTVEFLLK